MISTFEFSGNKSAAPLPFLVTETPIHDTSHQDNSSKQIRGGLDQIKVTENFIFYHFFHLFAFLIMFLHFFAFLIMFLHVFAFFSFSIIFLLS